MVKWMPPLVIFTTSKFLVFFTRYVLIFGTQQKQKQIELKNKNHTAAKYTLTLAPFLNSKNFVIIKNPFESRAY